MLAQKNHHPILATSLNGIGNFSFTFVDAEDYAALEQLQQIFICI
jgi:hypothetical protein